MSDLRKLVEAATPGHWSRAQGIGGSQLDSVRGGERGRTLIAFGCGRPEDAAYIAAANPQAVIGLLDERDRLRAENEGLRAERDSARATERARAERILRALADAYRALHGGGGEYCHALATALDFINQDERSQS